MKEIRISAKDLGALNMPDFCPKCFWIKRNCKALPFQIFPGIFSSIDSWTKNLVHAHFAAYNGPPVWLPEAQGAVKCLPSPHWSKFKRTDPVTGITLSGVVDDIFETAGRRHIIYDYKTAKFTEGQDKLIPMYQAQLNGYAWIGEGCKLDVEALFMAYFEPVTQKEDCARLLDLGTALCFTVKTVPVEIVSDMIPGLLCRAKEILDLSVPPPGVDGCKDCEKLRGLLLAVTGDLKWAA